MGLRSCRIRTVRHNQRSPEQLGIDVNGQNRTNTNGYGELSGVFLRDVSGNGAGVFNSKINDFGNSKWSQGISVFGDSSLKLKSNKISDYGFGGIVAYGDNGPAADPNVTTSGNTVTGGGTSSGIVNLYAQNGITYELGATGSITGNTVTHN